MGIVEKVLVWRLISIVSGITIVLQVVLLLAEALFECWRELLKKVRKKWASKKTLPEKRPPAVKMMTSRTITRGGQESN